MYWFCTSVAVEAIRAPVKILRTDLPDHGVGQDHGLHCHIFDRIVLAPELPRHDTCMEALAPRTVFFDRESAME